MKSEVLRLAAQKKVFLSPEALEAVLSNSKPMEFINTVLSSLAKDSIFIDKKDIMGCIEGDKVIFTSPRSDPPRNKRQTDISVIAGTDVTGESTCEGKINDFANYFRNRYHALRKIIEKRSDFGVAMNIERAITLGRNVNIIGIVYGMKETKNGHTILTVEDDTATCSVLISKDSPLAGETFVYDEVIGISGKSSMRGDLFIAEEIFRPDVGNHRWMPSDSTSSIGFLSDVHIGSSTFLKSEWDRMVSWVKAEGDALGLDYIVFPGDVVDGIGVFPGQEEELNINDIFQQYDTFAEYIKELPDHIKMVVQPGNHDAVRLAEPQPALNTMFTKAFDSNVMQCGNPIHLDVEGRVVASYHGKSLDEWINAVRSLTYDDPLNTMEEMLKRRHLSPIYGGKTALAPEKKDYLVIERVPDIFVSGHVHGADHRPYKDIRMINASAWQSQTSFQKMHNFNPKPAIMPLVHLGTGECIMKDFMI